MEEKRQPLKSYLLELWREYLEIRSKGVENLSMIEQAQLTELERILRLGLKHSELYPDAYAIEWEQEIEEYDDEQIWFEDGLLLLDVVGSTSIQIPEQKSAWPTLILPENHQSVRNISLDVLQRLAPQEYAYADYYIDPYIEMAAWGDYPTYHPGDVPGGLGDSNILIVIVPIVAAVIDGILQRLGEITLDAIKQKFHKGEIQKSRVEVQINDIRAIIQVIGYPTAKRELDALVAAIQAAIFEELSIK